MDDKRVLEIEKVKKISKDKLRERELASPKQIEKNSWAVRAGVKRTVLRPREEYDIQFREDRIGRYFKKYLSKFVFAEFSDEYLTKGGMTELMAGVPIPLRREDLEGFRGGAGIKPTTLAANMAWIMGIDPHFQYTSKYVEFLLKIFNKKIAEGMLKTGRDAAERKEYDEACIHFRATLCMDPEYLHGMYSYARVTREMYMASDNPEYLGRFKAESLDFFELTTEAHPRHAQSFYYLGYAYLNLGLYTKAQLAWKKFLAFTKNPKDRREIDKRMKQIEEPVIIEQAINKICTGKVLEGLPVLEKYKKSEFSEWWPLYYYLGMGYVKTGKKKDAVNSFKKVLEKNPSHIESMKELTLLFKESGDKESYEKYTNKIEIVKKSLEEEKKQGTGIMKAGKKSTEEMITRVETKEKKDTKPRIKRLK